MNENPMFVTSHGGELHESEMRFDDMLDWSCEVADLAQSDYGLERAYFDPDCGEWEELWSWVEQYVQTVIDATGTHPIDLGYTTEDAADEFNLWMEGRVTDDDFGPCGLTDYDGFDYWDSEFPGGALSKNPVA